MSDPRDSKQGDSSFTVGILIGGALGFILGAALVGFAGYGYMQKLMEADLEDKDLPTDLATSSFIQQSERSQSICGKAST